MSVEPSERRVRANGLEHHIVQWDGGGMRGETVVLCHGFLDIAWSWDAVGRQLAGAGYRAVAFDWRGHGDSEWIGRGGYYHFPDYVLDLEELLPQLGGGESVHLVGHSMGGTACAMFAGTRPKALRTLTLVEGLGPPAREPGDTPERFATWLDAVARRRGAAPKPMRDAGAALERMRVQNPRLPEQLGRFLADKATRPAEDGSGRVWCFDPLHRTLSPRPFAVEAFRAFLGRIEAPALVVFGQDGYRLADEAERRAALPQSHRFVEIADVGHMIHWMAPARLVAAMTTHFDGARG